MPLQLLGTLERPQATSPHNAHRVEGLDDLRARIQSLRTALEERSDGTLERLTRIVRDALTDEFTAMRKKAREHVAVLAQLAEVDDIEVPADIDAEMGSIAARVAWRPVAEAAVLELLETATSLAQPASHATPLTTEQWIGACLDRLDRAIFAEDTGLEGADVDLSMSRAANSIIEWPDLATHMPILFRDVLLTVAATADGVVIAKGLPMMLLGQPSGRAAGKADPFSVIFDQYDPDDGVAVLAEGEVAVVGASEETALTQTDCGDTSVVAYGVADDALPLALPIAGDPEQALAGAATTELGEAEEIQLDGRLLWDPTALEIQAVGDALLFKPKVGDHGLQLGRAESLAGSSAVAKDGSEDVEIAAVLVTV